MLKNFPYDCPFNEKGPFINLFMTTHSQSPENKQDSIVFKNLIAKAKDKLSMEFKPMEVERFIQPLEELERETPFWTYNHAGLAVFVNRENCYVYRLPEAVRNHVILSESLNFKPLIRMFQSIIHYYVLALSRERFKVYEVYHKSIEEVQFDKDVLILAKDVIGDQRSEPYMSIGGFGQSGTQAMLHGHGGKKEEIDIDTEKYFRYVDQTIYDHLSKDKAIPIVLVTLHKNQMTYRKVSKNKQLYNEGVVMSVEDLSKQELYQETIKLIEPYFNEQLKRQTAKVAQSIELGRASDNLDHIIKAIVNKEVKNLYLIDSKRIYGTVDWDKQEVVIDQSIDSDVLEELAEQALQAKAKVYSVPKDWLETKNGILVEYF
jgi:hypothetical protein